MNCSGKIANETVCLLQSGGRDSTAAAIYLLESGKRVLGLTLAENAQDQVDLPRQRAIELACKYKNYCWRMVDFTMWNRGIKVWVQDRLSSELPKSCLLCALSKITSAIAICNHEQIFKISLGYTDYQSDWAEQSTLAIKLQKEKLKNLGFMLLLPSLGFKKKKDVQDFLIVKELNPNSLENPCCISDWGTQQVSDGLIVETINLAFQYAMEHSPDFTIVATVGNNSQ